MRKHRIIFMVKVLENMLNINWLTSSSELLFVFFITSIIILYYQYRQRYQYWKQLGVKQFNPIFPVGDLSTAGLGITSIYVRVQFLYDQIKQNNLKFGGIYYFNGPTFLPIAPDLIKRIMMTDFAHFMDRGVYIDEKNLPISAHLFSIRGERWRSLRTKLSSAFTPGKLKCIHNIIIKNVEDLIRTLRDFDQQEFDLKEILLRYGIDNIANIAFGIDCNSLKNPNNKFSQMVDRIFNAPSWEFFKLLIQEGLSNPGNLMKIVYTNEETVKYFTDLVHATVEFRDKNHFVRDDFMQLFLKLRDTDGLTMDEIVAQCYLFFFAGYETTSSTISYAIHELAYNQQLQDDLRNEIVKNIGEDVTKFEYQSLVKLPLLDKTVKETLRMYPVAPVLYRIVGKPYTIPDTDIVLEPGTPVILPVCAIQRDPDYFPEPMKFDPERFNNDNIDNIVPYSYIPFGDGPRNCIGMRLGLMQVKLGLAALLSNFRFYAGRNSKRVLPFKPSTTSPVLVVEGGVPVYVRNI